MKIPKHHSNVGKRLVDKFRKRSTNSIQEEEKNDLLESILNSMRISADTGDFNVLYQLDESHETAIRPIIHYLWDEGFVAKIDNDGNLKISWD